MLTVPLFGPIIRKLGFDPIWFGVLFAVNMQMSFLTPPFGMSLFYLKSVAPPEVSTADVWKSGVPFRTSAHRPGALHVLPGHPLAPGSFQGLTGAVGAGRIFMTGAQAAGFGPAPAFSGQRREWGEGGKEQDRVFRPRGCFRRSSTGCSWSGSGTAPDLAEVQRGAQEIGYSP
jgi:hypothetical protein